MSKKYRDAKKRMGAQSIHKGRHVHQLEDVVPLKELIEEVREGKAWQTTN